MDVYEMMVLLLVTRPEKKFICIQAYYRELLVPTQFVSARFGASLKSGTLVLF